MARTDEEKLKILLELIEKKAKESSFYEDPESDLYSCSGGNIDDAFSIGSDDGEICFAKKLLDSIKDD